MWPDIDAWSIVRLTSFRKGLLFGKGWQGYQMDFFVTVQKIKHSTALSLLLKVKSESDICFWWLKISLFFSKVFRLCLHLQTRNNPVSFENRFQIVATLLSHLLFWASLMSQSRKTFLWGGQQIWTLQTRLDWIAKCKWILL